LGGFERQGRCCWESRRVKPRSGACSFVAVPGDVRTHEGGEQVEDLAGLRVPACLCLGVEDRVIDEDVEHAVVARNQGQVFDDVLVGPEEVCGHAHGAGGIVSGDAVGDADSMGGPVVRTAVAHGCRP